MTSIASLDPEDDDDLDAAEVEPDDPDQWRDCAEDHDTMMDEALDAEGVPLV